MIQLMEVLNKRIDQIIEERKSLEKFIQHDKDLEEELHYIFAILEKHKGRSTSETEASYTLASGIAQDIYNIFQASQEPLEISEICNRLVAQGVQANTSTIDSALRRNDNHFEQLDRIHWYLKKQPAEKITSEDEPPSVTQYHQEVILNDKPTSSQSYYGTRVRHSPGEAEKHIIQILSRGETHSTASLVKRLKEVFNLDYSDSTVGVTLRRGAKQEKFERDGYQWSMVLNQNQLSQQQEETLIDNDEEGSTDDENALL
jgi:predicted transcriptional regulator